jgi:hypothetical protein
MMDEEIPSSKRVRVISNSPKEKVKGLLKRLSSGDSGNKKSLLQRFSFGDKSSDFKDPASPSSVTNQSLSERIITPTKKLLKKISGGDESKRRSTEDIGGGQQTKEWNIFNSKSVGINIPQVKNSSDHQYNLSTSASTNQPQNQSQYSGMLFFSAPEDKLFSKKSPSSYSLWGSSLNIFQSEHHNRLSSLKQADEAAPKSQGIAIQRKESYSEAGTELSKSYGGSSIDENEHFEQKDSYDSSLRKNSVSLSTKSISEAGEYPETINGICAHFLRGKCRFKEKCRNSHDIHECPYCNSNLPKSRLAASGHLSKCYRVANLSSSVLNNVLGNNANSL